VTKRDKALSNLLGLLAGRIKNRDGLWPNHHGFSKKGKAMTKRVVDSGKTERKIETKIEKEKEEKVLQQRASENIIARPFRRIAYAISPERVVLDKEQFCHIVNSRTGKTLLVEGPVRRVLEYDERVVHTGNKTVVPENHFVIIKNPAVNGTVAYGKREVRRGPVTFGLLPGEKLEGRVTAQFVLTQYDGLLIRVVEDFARGENILQAGDEFLIRGPQTYIPSKQEKVIQQTKAVSLSDTDGIYVQNKDTGDVNLIKGPADYFLKPNEIRYQKDLTTDELAGVGLQRATRRGASSDNIRILTRQAANTSFLHDHSNALVLELEEKEVVLLYDGSESRIELGPKTVFVGPYERPKILTLSGGKPIEQGVLKVGLLKLGPDFIYDRIKVRTKDNAQIIVDVTYKWRFRTDGDLKDAFSIDDFVGYAAETLSSDIRSVVAKHDFEDLHVSALKYAQDAIFGEGNTSRVFEENGLEIFGIDITSIIPEDPKIAEKLHEAIKHNMDVYCKKIVLVATLEAERQEVEGKKKIEAERGDLIDAQNENSRKEIVEKARINAERTRILAEGDAAAIKIRADAETDSEKKRLDSVVEALNGQGADKYLELERARVFANTEKLVIVPPKAKIVLPEGLLEQ
jgi:major vault protein